jgi:hypothetical protein
MKIFLDDTRIPLDCIKHKEEEIFYNKDWEIVKSFDEFKVLLDHIVANNMFEEIELISYDHDLADEHYNSLMMDPDHSKYTELYPYFLEKTGLDCVKYLIDLCLDHNLKLPHFIVHTQNPVGYVKIESMLKNFKKHQNGAGI